MKLSLTRVLLLTLYEPAMKTLWRLATRLKDDYVVFFVQVLYPTLFFSFVAFWSFLITVLYTALWDCLYEGAEGIPVPQCLPLRNIPVQITPNIHTPSISPLSHLTPHPPTSNVQVHEDREEEPVDYKLLTAVQVTGKGKELSGDIPTVAIPSSSSSFAPCPAGPSLPQRRLTLRDWCQPRKAAVRRWGWWRRSLGWCWWRVRKAGAVAVPKWRTTGGSGGGWWAV